MKPLNFTIIKLTICLIAGILLSYYISLNLNTSFYTIVTVLIVLFAIYLIANRQLKKTIWFGLISYIFMMCLGILTHQLHDKKNVSNHYTHLIDTESNQPRLLTFKIRERLKPTTYNNKYVVDLITIDSQSVTGKSLLNIAKDSLQNRYNIDDVLLMYSSFEPVHRPLNPNQFNYKTYLEKQYIYHQLYAEQHSLLKLESQQHTVFGYAARLRDKINKKLNTYNFKAEELAIINALILGQRQDMSKDIYQRYANAGAIHILAVSGLHVGIILLLLNIALKPIERLKHGKLIKVGLILILLWSFAIIAGLSASVTRAVTMFSIVAIALHWKRATNIYNTLAISVFILLLFKPMFLFDVGFQMSYLAVLAIVSIQPILYKLWQPKWKIIDYFWQIFTVTIAAQFGVVPVSLYYFHQFPGLFFVSNLAIIPFLSIILGLGILIIILALFNALPEFLANLFGNIISLMNSVVGWVSHQETFLLKDISFDVSHVITSYVLIITSVLMFKKINFRRISLVLISILLIQGVWMASEYRNANNSFTIFHKSRYSIIAHKMHSELNVYHNLDSITASNDRVVSNYSVGNFINKINRDSLKSVYQFQNKTLLVIDSLGVYNVNSFQPDYVLLRNSPRINLERMIDSIHPKYIIADGSNYKSYIKRWEVTCIKRKLPFHQTGKKGAFIIK
ncbi:MAG: ComEC/Rec2 family competence protein [Psychroserpens sp.]|uniref:ComEC/Rec2 family competence protein n=1 Tax=Psychroserpens sp. TaxID=2020870 RepID=UPI0030039D05